MTKEQEDMPTLSDADANMLDRLVEAEFDPSKITGLDAADQARLDRLVSFMGLLDAYPVEDLSSEDRSTLVNATLARIDRAEGEQVDRMRLQPGAGSTSRMGVPELIAVAAIIILVHATSESYSNVITSKFRYVQLCVTIERGSRRIFFPP